MRCVSSCRAVMKQLNANALYVASETSDASVTGLTNALQTGQSVQSLITKSSVFTCTCSHAISFNRFIWVWVKCMTLLTPKGSYVSKWACPWTRQTWEKKVRPLIFCLLHFSERVSYISALCDITKDTDTELSNCQFPLQGSMLWSGCDPARSSTRCLCFWSATQCCWALSTCDHGRTTNSQTAYYATTAMNNMISWC